MDVVLIEGLRVDAVVGVHDREQERRQLLVFDLELGFDNRRAAASDALADTHDYAAISAGLGEFVRARPWRLVETVAERGAEFLRDRYGVARLRLTVRKPGAVAEAHAVGVRIERDFGSTAAAAGRNPAPR